MGTATILRVASRWIGGKSSIGQVREGEEAGLPNGDQNAPADFERICKVAFAAIECGVAPLRPGEGETRSDAAGFPLAAPSSPGFASRRIEQALYPGSLILGGRRTRVAPGLYGLATS